MDKFLFPNNNLLSEIAIVIGGIAIILILNYTFEELF